MLYANTTFYLKDLTLHRFCYPWGILQLIYCGHCETSVHKSSPSIHGKVMTFMLLTGKIRLPDISPAKVGLFGISRKLQFKVCNHGKPHASPCKASEEHF